MRDRKCVDQLGAEVRRNWDEMREMEIAFRIQCSKKFIFNKKNQKNMTKQKFSLNETNSMKFRIRLRKLNIYIS